MPIIAALAEPLLAMGARAIAGRAVAATGSELAGQVAGRAAMATGRYAAARVDQRLAERKGPRP